MRRKLLILTSFLLSLINSGLIYTKFVAIDKIDMNLNVEYKKGSVIFGNKTFKYRLPQDGIEGENETKASFPKDYLAMLDGESYSITVGKTRIVFESNDSKTIIVVGRNDA